MANEKILCKFLTFEKFNKGNLDWNLFSRNHYLFFCIFNNHPLWNSFSNDKPFPSSVFLSFWTTCPPTLTSTGKGKLFMNLCCLPGLWDVSDGSPDITRSDEMWWGRSLEPGYSREYFMMTTDPRSVIRSSLRLHRPWLCCYNNYYYTRASHITLLCYAPNTWHLKQWL